LRGLIASLALLLTLGGAPASAGESAEPRDLLVALMDAPPPVFQAEMAHAFTFFDLDGMERAQLRNVNRLLEYIVANCERLAIIDKPLHYVTLLAELWTTGETSLPVALGDNTQLASVFIGMFVPGKTPVTADIVKDLASLAGLDVQALPIEEMARLARRAQLARYGAV
jgi:hypothetical protein